MNNINNLGMNVVKRGGEIEEVSFDKVTKRIKNLSHDLSVNAHMIAQKVCQSIYDGVKTTELDELTGQVCASLGTEELDYSTLASRIIISNHHKNTSPSFSETISSLYNNYDIHRKQNPLVCKDLYEMVMKNKEKLNDYIKYDRDYMIDYFGFKTLEKSYLYRINGKVIERPQDMYMRVSLGIHGDDFKDALKTYDLMTNKYFIHATPTLFNSGSNRPQLSSCFLVAMKDDSIEGIYETLKQIALISKWSGGIGTHIHNIRGSNSLIRGTNGNATGIIPMLRVFNNTARYVNQGGKRNGSFAFYLEPWHCDITDFLKLRKNHGNEEERTRDLFLALWIPDLFMKRVKNNENWTLMCPDECPGLSDKYGDDFEELYNHYEKNNMGKKTISAQELWFSILDAQIETGTPYMLYKDACNRKSNQKNIGIIKSSNLCTEIIEVSKPDEIAVCNLASIGLPMFVENGKFNLTKLIEVTRIITKNLNKVIDINYYPVKDAETSNKKHRPIGIGVQGLADVFAKLKIPFESNEAKILNEEIFQTIYYAALLESMEISKKRKPIMKRYLYLIEKISNQFNIDIDRLYENGEVQKLENMEDDETKELVKLNKILKPIKDELINFEKNGGAYSSYYDSPISKGILQFDLWNKTPLVNSNVSYDWNQLRSDIIENGVRNSLLLAPMPTASTSQILGNNEAFEPYTSNIYARKTLAGEFTVINKHLLNDLGEIGLWDKNMKEEIIYNNGSIQNIKSIPEDIKLRYKTVWEIKQKCIIDMAADRGIYICQSQSMNLFIAEPNFKVLSSMHFYSWEKGLKTGMYYLRTKPVSNAQQFSIEPGKFKNNDSNETDNDNDNDNECISCSA